MPLTEEGIQFVPGLLSRWVRLGGGAKAHYMTAGETGPAVVLLHGGLPGSSGAAGWRFMAPFLGANGFRVYCPDQPSFGLADTAEEHWPIGVESFVDFLHEFTTALCLDSFHLAGNSMGGTTTVNYLLAHPDRVLSFALIACDPGDVMPGERKRNAPAAFDGSEQSMRNMLQAIMYRPEVVPDELVAERTAAANRHAPAYARVAAAMAKGGGRVGQNEPNVAVRLRTRDRLDQIETPGIYLYGQNDVLTSVEWGYEQEDRLPNIQFFYPAECGHQGQSDQPDMFNQVFLEFFRDGRITAKTAEWAGVSTRRPVLPSVVAES